MSDLTSEPRPSSVATKSTATTSFSLPLPARASDEGAEESIRLFWTPELVGRASNGRVEDRSPAWARRAVGCSELSDPAATGVPHWRQNPAPGTKSPPHREQVASFILLMKIPSRPAPRQDHSRHSADSGVPLVLTSCARRPRAVSNHNLRIRAFVLSGSADTDV